MKYYLRGTFWFTAFLSIFFVIVFWVSLGYNPKARFVPIVLSIPMFLLTIYLLLGEKYPKLISGFEGALPTSTVTNSASARDKDKKEKENKKQYALIGLLIGTYISIICVGFLIHSVICDHIRQVLRETYMASGPSGYGGCGRDFVWAV